MFAFFWARTRKDTLPVAYLLKCRASQWRYDRNYHHFKSAEFVFQVIIVTWQYAYAWDLFTVLIFIVSKPIYISRLCHSFKCAEHLVKTFGNSETETCKSNGRDMPEHIICTQSNFDNFENDTRFDNSIRLQIMKNFYLFYWSFSNLANTYLNTSVKRLRLFWQLSFELLKQSNYRNFTVPQICMSEKHM